MNSVEKVKAICKERKIPISRLEKDLGYANGYIGQLRKGTFPDDRLVEIANYLNVATSYLTGEEEKEKHSTEGEVLKALTPDRYEEFLSSLTLEEIKALYEKMGEEMAKRIGK